MLMGQILITGTSFFERLEENLQKNKERYVLKSSDQNEKLGPKIIHKPFFVAVCFKYFWKNILKIFF